MTDKFDIRKTGQRALLSQYDDVWLMDGVRTPFSDYNTVLGLVSPIDLGIKVAREIFHRSGVSPESVDTVIAGNMAYLSGHGPLKADKTLITGRVGADMDQEAGKAAARQAGLAILATLREALGSLDRVKRIVKTLALVNCTPEFTQQPYVINGFSDLIADVFGTEAGIGARSAVGATALPGNMAVEVEAIFEIE